jgi:nucleoside-diphosphate-sugar epimerase
MGTSIFLTGVSGYLGSVLADRLASMPEIDCITGIYNATTPPPPKSPKLNFIRMDIRSPDLARAMAGHEVVVHSAFVVMWKASLPAQVRDDINFNGTRNMACAAIQNRVNRFIHASSVAAYDLGSARGMDGITEDFPVGTGNLPWYYPNSKAVSERLLMEILGPSGIPVTLLRPCTITGPRDRVDIKNFRENAMNCIGRDPRIQFVHEDDVVEAFIQAILMEMPGAYNIVPNDFLRNRVLNRLLGVKFAPPVPVWLARLVTYFQWRYFGSSIHPSWVDTMLVDATVSNAKLKSTGWAPQYTSEAAVRSAAGVG